MKSTFKLIVRTAATVILASAIAPMILAQQDNPAPGQGGRRDDSERIERDRAERERREIREREMRERELQERQFNLRMLEKEARRPVERHEPRLALTQIREDFMRLQAVNNDLTQAVLSGASLDPKFLTKSASEIKKRAERLKLNLMLPEPEKGTKRLKAEVGAEPEQLKLSLAAISELIIGFVSNPMFQNANTVDAQHSAKARRDLEEIIELSSGIRKSSERLNKAAQKLQ